MSGTAQSVEMGETWVSKAGADRLVAHGLGACVALCLYDAAARLAAMVHVVLPETIPWTATGGACRGYVSPPGKCADTAVRHAIDQILQQGARPERLRAAIAGGAHIFTHAAPSGSNPGLSRLEVGPRNVQAVRAALEAEGIPLAAEDVGGSYGRNLTFCVATGDIFIRRIGAEETLMVCLAHQTEEAPALAH